MVVPAKVTVVPARSLERSRVELPGTATLSRIMEVHAAVADGMAEYAVTEHMPVATVGEIDKDDVMVWIDEWKTKRLV